MLRPSLLDFLPRMGYTMVEVAMADKRIHSVPRTNQLLLALMGAVLLYLVVGFVQQVGVSHQRQQELKVLDQSLIAAREESEALQQQLDYSRSSAAVRDWALRHAWAQPGEQLVVPVGRPPDPSPDAAEERGDRSGLDSPPNAWWDLFFGTR